ncbi:MAG TPA: gliding motility-associated C-terminal domain-containing protein [Bacteroidales bacterium]|nr:gliding motility-associated C-terminal domain-containing protein [Bacteroidales bacterium]HNS46777.1 gliding motility-associated C-terminal domain-containing protein [Bacteroidales bacterium]
MRITAFAILLFFSLTVSAQDDCDYIPPRQANTWYFYLNAGIEFNTTPVPLGNNTLLSDGFTKTAVSVLCDESGDLLLFSDGERVWNSNFQELTYSYVSKLSGSNDCSQSSLFIPNPDPTNPYCYLFTVDVLDPFPQPWASDGLRYSIINIQTGHAQFPNIQLKPKAAEKLTGVRHGNGMDYWAIAHGYDVSGGESDVFYSYLITEEGVTENPVTSKEGLAHDGIPGDQNSVGYMKAAPDGSKLAVAIFGKDVVELFDFDNQTGRVGEDFRFTSDKVDDAFCLEFSPDGSKLYVSTYVPQEGHLRSYIYQYDLAILPANPLQQKEIITSSIDSVYAGMQLAPDGKIYISAISRDGSTRYKSLSVIENPNRPGTDCNFVAEGITLQGSGAASYRGLVNVNQSFVDIPHFTYLNHCFGDSTTFTISNDANTDRWEWDFDGDDVMDTIAENPFNIFPSPGTFQVAVTEYLNNKPFTNSEPVVIYPLPVIDVGSGEDTIYKYPGAPFELNAGEGFDFYYWNDQPGGPTYIAYDTGLYQVMVIDSNCCYNVDRVWIYDSKIIIPNAFTPNGDGVNDFFKPLILTEGVKDFSMAIYNRWGQLIFETNDYMTGWNGNSNNNPSPTGVYIYMISYRVPVGIGEYKSETQKKHVTLLR